MSSINTGRIKQIRTKNEAGFSTGVPIGTDGILVDMLSELDLEEEIKLGGNHYVEITQTDVATEIKEWYYSKVKGTKSKSEMSEYVTYSASVVIASFEDQNICIPPNDSVQLQDWIWGEPEDNALVDRLPISSENQTIIMTLYRYDMDNGGTKLHEKTIYIHEDPINNEITIDEQITYPQPIPEPEPEPNPQIEPDSGEPEGGNEP